MAKPHYVSETQIVQELASDPETTYVWKRHALKQMYGRGILEEDVNFALTNGQVELIETDKKDILWRIVGRDIDGNRITVVGAFDRDEGLIKVVTAF